MEKTRVSILMPAYNAADYIADSIQSIIKQTYTNFELIIYNDGSTDQTGLILAQFQKLDSRIQVIDSKINRGLTFGRNILLQSAKADLVSWLDADDIAYPTRIEAQVAFLAKNPDFAGVSCWARMIDHESRPTGQFIKNYMHHTHLKAISLFVNYFVVSGMTLRKSTIPQNGFNPAFSPAEDYDLFVRLLEHHKLAILPKVLVDYRTHANNLTATQSDKMKNAVLGIQKRQLEQLHLDVSPENLHLHYTISFAANVPLQEAEEWLIQIKQANQQHERYDKASLTFILGHRWIKILERTAGLSPILVGLRSELFKFNLHSLFIVGKKILNP